jgi:hypothetical protein
MFLLLFAFNGLLSGQLFIPDLSKYGRYRHIGEASFASGDQLIWVFLSYVCVSIVAFTFAYPFKTTKPKLPLAGRTVQDRAKARDAYRNQLLKSKQFLILYASSALAAVFALVSIFYK